MAKYINSKGFEPIKVGKQGKLFELLISRIEEAKNFDSTIQILPNKSLVNKGGHSRQFDLIIKSSINEFEICIAVECKEHTRPVDVEKIEAFKGKCERINEINKKVFVSNSGFTDGAIDAAKDFGIQLLKIEELNHENVLNWTKPLNFHLQKRYILVKRLIANNYEQKVEFNDLNHNTVYFKGFGNPISLNDFCTSYVIELSDSEWDTWFNGKDDRSKPVICQYVIYPEVPMEIGCVHQKSIYTRFYFLSEIWQEDIILTKSQTKGYQKIDSNEFDAVFIELDGIGKNGERAKGEIIQTKNTPNLTLNMTLIEGKEIVAKITKEINIQNFTNKFATKK